MKRDTIFRIITTVSILIFIFFFFESSRVGLPSYRNDTIIFSILLILFYFLRNMMNLNPVTYSLLSLAFIFHNLGVFGFYSTSPLPFEWDLWTHGFGLFAYSIMFYNYFKQYFTSEKKRNALILLLVIFSTLGIGAIIEMVEFSGYLYFGKGEGFLLYGAGDAQPDSGPSADYVDSMYDLFYNSAGALIGVLVCLIYYNLINKSPSSKY